MPTPTTVKLLVDETNEDGKRSSPVEHVWSDPRLPHNRRRASGCAAFCAIACVMFILGATIGAAVYTYLTPGAFRELLNWTTSSGNGDEMLSDDFEELIEQHCPDFPWDELRLPNDIRPDHYNISIHPDIDAGRLSGQVAIDLRVENETSVIVLHAHRLNLSSFYINVNNRKVNAEHSECDVLQQWAFTLDKPVEENDEIVLGIEYDGLMLADMHGLYISTHHSNNGKIWKSVASQFEPNHARKAFPCFDEPNLKATFQVSVVREPEHVTRSNTNLRVTREHSEEGLYIDVFEKSVKMSTYLLAVAVLDNYDYNKRLTKTTAEPIEVRLYASRDVLKGQADFGLDVATKALEYFEDYFNISYPLDKVDLLALDDFAEGAMENWGLITFRDSSLLYNEKTSGELSKEHIALVICHEIAHQWFGNLVTMDWWNDLWLNEGFANYMEYKCVDHIFPKWKIMSRFYAENAGSAMEPDGLSSSRPINAGLESNTTNIMSLFDAISYHKAAAIIHMLQGLAGEWYFQKALIEYLNKYKYDNAKGEELWRIVEKHASLPHGVTVESLAKAFTTQVGYPLIQIGLVNNDEEILVHNQTRFLFDRDHKKNDKDGDKDGDGDGDGDRDGDKDKAKAKAGDKAGDKDESEEDEEDENGKDDDDSDDEKEKKEKKKMQKKGRGSNEDEDDEDLEWPIPVHFRTDDKGEPQLKWLRPGEQKVHWRLDSPSKWVIANSGGIGYFKVLYDKKIYRELNRQLNRDHSEISAIDRTMLITDAFDFTKVGLLDIGTYMDMVQYAEDERDRMAWTMISQQMESIEGLIEETDYIHLFRDFQRSLVVKVYEELGWDDGESDEKEESPSRRGLQQTVLSFACRLNHGDCSKKAIQRFNQWAVSKKPVTPELQGIIFSEGIKHGDSALWEKAYTAFQSATTPKAKQNLMEGMAATKDPKLVNRLLRMTLDSKSIKANTIHWVLSALAKNELSRTAAWRFFRINYDDYEEILGKGSNLLFACIRGLVDKTSTKHDLEELKEFLESKNLENNRSKLEQLFENIEVNIQWRELNEEKLEEYLREWDERRRRLHRRHKQFEGKF
ncbi:unnamed protein product, partial [Mesorhabditis belari]|uniref:Aminopeptidase n=1 Tax=Mesorhabditis belari TaxID=2138241 RepID=A0AAF3J5U6_9BILA